MRSRFGLIVSDFPSDEGLDIRILTGERARTARAQAAAARTASDGKSSGDANRRKDDDPTTADRAAQYAAVAPRHRFEQLIVADTVREELLAAVAVLKVRDRVFLDWGLSAIEPSPRSALNFHGPPGVGKTLAAHALSDMLGKKILLASYADVESKYVGDGPKNVQALFLAAERDDAVLFVDEADSLLSKRLTSVNAGSDQAINSMRSQLLIALEQFSGVVIFATNLVTNYDPAFETRVRSVAFTLPDAPARRKIWETHLPARLPQSDVDLDALAAVDDVCGREIKNAVVDAAIRAADAGRDGVTGPELVAALQRVIASRPRKEEKRAPQPVVLAPEEEADLSARILGALDRAEGFVETPS